VATNGCDINGVCVCPFITPIKDIKNINIL